MPRNQEGNYKNLLEGYHHKLGGFDKRVVKLTMIVNHDEKGLQDLENGPAFDESKMGQLDGATAALAKQGLAPGMSCRVDI